MKRIYLYFISCAAAVIGLCTSCDAQLEQINPNKATEDTFWQNEADFELALTSCYTPLKNALNGGYYGTRGVMMRIARADEVEFRNDISDVFQACYFTNTNGNTLSQGMFYQFYNALYRTNSIMQKLDEKSAEFSADFVNKVKAECLFIRGFYLFQLGKEFKDAPLRLTASQSPSTFPLAKSTQAEIWAQAEQDLTTAASLLPVENSVIGKPTKGAAFAVLGKLYVYEEEFDKAIDALEPLTQAPYTYRLVEDFSWNFDEAHENNAESIFELLMEPVGGTDIWGDGENINSTQTNTRPKEYAAPEASGWYEANPTQQMMNIFLQEKDKDGNSDYRARSSVAWDYDGCMYYMQPFREIFKTEDRWSTYWILKYQNSSTATSEADPPMSVINERAVRYADVLLLLSESYLRSSGRQDLAKAVGYLNQIRERANLNPYSGAQTSEAIFSDLEHQRAIEFFVEGERFYDLRRWGLLEERMQTCNEARYNQLKNGKVGNTNRYYYYPIPSKEIETNPLCTPNEGW
ncbi:RagB/SusD family nutrient uptake outer membrane protein [Parabacteroides sp. AF17-28]|uniref:RagB/SusD family nutrient uptake outer membrane protein n=1 Tax=Parabacteroides sp. AF17-28 TaxID=2292241 RepID=UPI000F00E1A7|nr:RagB/SusD family nutrient uptake outer membrane protein [Parabacteroides sp. AF17-28]RHR60718.1 RagB/SusD family nutrient uptake outer membrane protein [Parabacteroides sp. AF17-28]